LTKERYGLETKQLSKGDTCYKCCNNSLIKVTIDNITENTREEQTYNLSHIANTHTFFANGVLVHNKVLDLSRIKRQKK